MSIKDPVLRVATVPVGTLTAPDGSPVYAVSGYTAPPPDGRPLKKAYAAVAGLGDGQRVIYVSNYPNGTLVTPDGRPVYALTAAAFGGGGDVTAPTITSSSTPTVAEGQPFNHTLTANEAVTWSKIGGADQLLFSVGGNTLSMTAKDFETPADANGDNAYVVTVRATDGGGNTTDQTITVTVTDVAEGGGGGGLDSGLTAPTLATDASSPADGSAPKINIASDDTLDIALGYKVVFRWFDKAGTQIGTGESGTLTAAPSGDDLTISNMATLPAGTRRYDARFERTDGSAYSAWSSPRLIVGPDDQEPALTAPTATAITDKTATLGVTTDTAEGTLYLVVVSTNSQPSNAQIKAGQNSASAAAAYASSQAIGSSGAKTFAASGLTASTGYYRFYLHRDVAGNETVLAGGLFTTDVPSLQKLANPGFDSDTAWTKGSGVVITGGAAFADSGVADIVKQNALTVGKTYNFSFDYQSDFHNGAGRIRVNNSNTPNGATKFTSDVLIIDANYHTVTGSFTATDTWIALEASGATFEGKIDNFTATEVA